MEARPTRLDGFGSVVVALTGHGSRSGRECGTGVRPVAGSSDVPSGPSGLCVGSRGLDLLLGYRVWAGPCRADVRDGRRRVGSNGRGFPSAPNRRARALAG